MILESQYGHIHFKNNTFGVILHNIVNSTLLM